MNRPQENTVFAVQNPMRWDASTAKFVPKFDLTPAEEYGAISYLLSPTVSPFRPDSLVRELHEKLSGIRKNDYLLLIGNPVLIGMVVSIASIYTNGSVNVLQWSGKSHMYLPVAIKNMYHDCQVDVGCSTLKPSKQ